MSYRLPSERALGTLLSTVFGQPVTASACDTSPVGSRHGLFVDADGRAVARVSCPLETAAALGCALSMIPPTGAQAMLEDGTLSKLAGDNLHEVMNILSSLFMDDGSSHLRLAGIEGGATPAIASDAAPEKAGSIAFELDLNRYGRCALEFAR